MYSSFTNDGCHIGYRVRDAIFFVGSRKNRLRLLLLCSSASHSTRFSFRTIRMDLLRNEKQEIRVGIILRTRY